MPECWIRSNQRLIVVGSILPFLALLVAVGLASSPAPVVLRWIGGLIALAVVMVWAGLVVETCRPRVQYADGKLLLYLRGRNPISVPIDAVECFFLGQGPTGIGSGELSEAEASNIVVRLAERDTEWHRREIKPALGRWCDGYITLHGAWCEPIDGKLVTDLNSKLAALKRQRKQDAVKVDAK